METQLRLFSIAALITGQIVLLLDWPRWIVLALTVSACIATMRNLVVNRAFDPDTWRE